MLVLLFTVAYCIFTFASCYFSVLSFLVGLLVQTEHHSRTPFSPLPHCRLWHSPAVSPSPLTTGLRLKRFSQASAHHSSLEAHGHHSGCEMGLLCLRGSATTRLRVAEAEEMVSVVQISTKETGGVAVLQTWSPPVLKSYAQFTRQIPAFTSLGCAYPCPSFEAIPGKNLW